MKRLFPEKDQVTVEVVVSAAGRVLDVYRMCPPRRYRLGDDAKTCDFVVPAETLGARSCVLFEGDLSSVQIGPGRKRDWPVAEHRNSLSVTIDDTVFRIRWCDEPSLRGAWCDVRTSRIEAASNDEDDDTFAATGVLSMPVFVRCSNCGARLEGHVQARGTVTKNDAKEDVERAAKKAREDAASNANTAAALARCPVCGRRSKSARAQLAQNYAISLAGVALPLLTLLRVLPADFSTLLVCTLFALGSIRLAAVRKAVFGAAGCRLRPRTSQRADASSDPYRGPSASEADEWRESATASALVLSLDVLDERATLDLSRASRGFAQATWIAMGCAIAALGAASIQAVTALRSHVIDEWEECISPLVLVVTFVVTSLMLRKAIIAAPWRLDPSQARGEFTLSLSAAGFDVAGPGVVSGGLSLPLAAIGTFEGGERLSIQLADGAVLTLPCSVRPGTNQALAARLNQALAERRAGGV